MLISDTTWTYPSGSAPHVSLVQIPRPLLGELARQEHGPATVASRLVTPYLTGPECNALWRLRDDQLDAQPADAAWVTRFVLTPGVAGAVGVAGFHGRPDPDGMVEVGYRIEPGHRRRGYARAALETLLAIAREHPSVKVVRASVSPGNIASRSLIDQYGFTEVGEQWDDQDGLETILELPVQG
ncbi:hypothetical protein GCM10009785_18960 [Brooklawnia cerclae]|uniref:RimJ/RimL family protein N-acetyltransferase n=1 Tax=Brooklawnia cerclae TaxID=349934 RepID=A0ABX0SLA1_9ACTN|nr:GNAT family protein [Brooklawnia cerclae]NIH57531.1 RimJ/RimL family protein N-acetyltransferase [Brooklawnia cerclae]